MEKYYMTGSLTDEMCSMLKNLPEFEPLDILISQLDRSAVKKAISWKEEGFCRSLFIDSGAFSIHTGKSNTTVDQYIDYINSIDSYVDVFAQLDTIPGKFGKPKSKEDYIESAKKSWENYLYMRSKVKSPDKLMPVFHYGEDVSALINMLEWRDENGKKLDYIGLSPANDASVSMKDVYLQEMFDIIKSSSNPDVKTHLYGYTSLQGLAKFPTYSADSVSHRLLSGYARVLTYNFGVISVSKRSRSVETKSNLSFLDTCDDHNLNILKKEFADLGFTIEEVQDSSAVRTVITMYNIQRLIKTKYKYSKDNLKKPRKLF